jgi:hypothetical protein
VEQPSRQLPTELRPPAAGIDVVDVEVVVVLERKAVGCNELDAFRRGNNASKRSPRNRAGSSCIITALTGWMNTATRAATPCKARRPVSHVSTAAGTNGTSPA